MRYIFLHMHIQPRGACEVATTLEGDGIDTWIDDRRRFNGIGIVNNGLIVFQLIRSIR